jgi:Aspartyl protease
MLRWFLPSLAVVLGCSVSPAEHPAPRSIPFSHAGGDSGAGHLLRVPVVVNGHATTFVLDTGIGITLVDDDLIEAWGITVDGSYTGQRMSGQEVEVPLATVPWLSVAGVRTDDVRVGVWDMAGFVPHTPEFEGVEGFLSLNAFAGLAFTLDYGRGALIVEDEASLAARAALGAEVPLAVKRDDPCLTIFFDLAVPGGPPAHVELDLGGGRLTLHARYMQRLGVEPDGDDVKRVEQRDETGHDYTRHFTRFAGPVAPAAAPGYEQRDVPVMFQEIIYDGLVGDDFLKQFTVTFDLPRERLILGPR